MRNSDRISYFKGAGSRNVNKHLSKQPFCSIFDRPYITVILHYFSQNEGVVFTGGGGGFFHSKGTWRCAARKGMLFQTF